MIQIKSIKELKDLRDIQHLEEQVWGNPPIPQHQTYTAIQNGGILLGAYEHHKLIGFLYGFPGFKNGSVYLCSHMLGVLPSYRKAGLGHKLKEHQRELAIQEGYSLIVWTFDPLESVNAYLNIHKLNGITGAYLENYYGNLNDSLNKGFPTDRFLVEWWIDSAHVKDSKAVLPTTTTGCQALFKTAPDEMGYPITIGDELTNNELTEKTYLVPIPDNFQKIKKERPELAMKWRLKTRKVFQLLLSMGYVAVDVQRKPDEAICFYVFTKKDDLRL
ncbi:GNAT family N-acetyltransferase [Bacillus sp. AK128]